MAARKYMIKFLTHKLFLGACALVLVLLLCIIGVLGWQLHDFSRTPLTDTDQVYRIPNGMSFLQLARSLERQSYISDHRLLRAYRYWYSDDAKPIQMGEYRIKAGMLPGDFLDMIESGKVNYYSFSIIPGSTFQQIIRKLRSLANIQHELPADVTEDNIMSFISDDAYRDFHGEGMFYSETYHYHGGSSDIDLLRIAHQLLVSNLEQHCAQLPDQVNSAYDALILASIVEKESGSIAEQAQIGRVFINRIKLNMRLEADPTVIYGLGRAYQGDIKRVHLRSDTAYNTYTRRGLPPTPIASVWKESLRSICQPLIHDYLYFVADGKGGHIFNKDYKSHLKSVRDYIRYQRSLK